MSGKKRAIETDWDKVDAYVPGPKDDEEIPELTDGWFDKATLHIGGVPVPHWRPKSARPKQPVSLRLDADVIAHFPAPAAAGRAASTACCARPPSSARRRSGRCDPRVAGHFSCREPRRAFTRAVGT